jgi:heme/copper-type cytochrome/quinol oxidase subunit 2
LFLLTAVILWLAGSPASACSVCFGDAEDPQTKGVAAAIIFMLVTTYLLLSTIIGLFVFRHFKNRGRLAAHKSQ